MPLMGSAPAYFDTFSGRFVSQKEHVVFCILAEND
jgi:hypothetical protein